MTKAWILGLGLVLGLAACGQTDLERGATGAAIGAGAAAVLDEEPLVGAALGAGAGVLSDDARRQVRGY